MIQRILREPLLHFLLLGAAFFLAYRLVYRPDVSDQPGTIVITRREVNALIDTFASTWQRPPTSEELAVLVRERVRDEVCSREASALGLEKDDVVIQRRLRQKLEFISEDVAALPEASEAELGEYLRTHAEVYRLPPRVTFRQVFLNPEKHPGSLSHDASQLLEALNRAGAAADVSALGDPLLLEQDYAAQPVSDIAREFGKEFADSLAALEAGRWQGPVESGYGVHLVLVSRREEGRLPLLAEVRDDVRRAFDSARRVAASDQFYEQLLKRFTVTVEESDPATTQKRLGRKEAK